MAVSDRILKMCREEEREKHNIEKARERAILGTRTIMHCYSDLLGLITTMCWKR